jgi:hypothetical protein
MNLYDGPIDRISVNVRIEIVFPGRLMIGRDSERPDASRAPARPVDVDAVAGEQLLFPSVRAVAPALRESHGESWRFVIGDGIAGRSALRVERGGRGNVRQPLNRFEGAVQLIG